MYGCFHNRANINVNRLAKKIRFFISLSYFFYYEILPISASQRTNKFVCIMWCYIKEYSFSSWSLPWLPVLPNSMFLALVTL